MFSVDIRSNPCNNDLSDDNNASSLSDSLGKTNSFDLYNMISQHEGNALPLSATNNAERTATPPHEFETCPCPGDGDDEPWTVLMEFSERDFLLPAEQEDDDLGDDDDYDDVEALSCRIGSDYTLLLDRLEQNCSNSTINDLSEGSSRPSSSRPVTIPTISRQLRISQRPSSSSQDNTKYITSPRIDIVSSSTQSTSIQIPPFSSRPLSSSLTRFPPGTPHHPLSWPVFRPLLDWWRRPSISGTVDSPSRLHIYDADDLQDPDIDDLLIDDIPNEVFEDDDDDESWQLSFRKPIMDKDDSSPKDRRSLQQMPFQGDFLVSPSCSVDLNRNILENPESGRHRLQESCANVGQMLRRLSDEFRPRAAMRKDGLNSRRYPAHGRPQRLTSRDIRQLFSAG